PTSGTYAGVVIFQDRLNTRALSLSGSNLSLHGGVVYAPAALASAGGSGQLQATLVVGQLQLSVNGASALTADGTETDSSATTAGQLLAGDLVVYVDNSAGQFTVEQLARIEHAISTINVTINPFGVSILEVSAADRDLATTVI